MYKKSLLKIEKTPNRAFEHNMYKKEITLDRCSFESCSQGLFLCYLGI